MTFGIAGARVRPALVRERGLRRAARRPRHRLHHPALRPLCRRAQSRHDDRRTRIVHRASRSSLPGVTIAALTTAATFYAFLATDFRGMSQLGFLTGTGVLFFLVCTAVVLPALIVISANATRRRRHRSSICIRSAPEKLIERLDRHPRGHDRDLDDLRRASAPSFPRAFASATTSRTCARKETSASSIRRE
jgi:hypothetical protein